MDSIRNILSKGKTRETISAAIEAAELRGAAAYKKHGELCGRLREISLIGSDEDYEKVCARLSAVASEIHLCEMAIDKLYDDLEVAEEQQAAATLDKERDVALRREAYAAVRAAMASGAGSHGAQSINR